MTQDAGEDEAGADEPEEAAAVYEVGMRKSARTEQIDFKQREEERWVQAALRGSEGYSGGQLGLFVVAAPAMHAPDMMTCCPLPPIFP